MRSSIRGLAVACLVLSGGTALAQQVEYPKVNTTATYVVDPTWPRRPANMKWAEMPGVAVDAQDRVWIYTRTENPVQVYDASGNFIKSWGQDTFKPKAAHHIKFDHEGNVWLADIEDHVVRKCTPDGKVLLTLGTPGQAGRDQTHLFRPTDMAITGGGDIFVADGYGNARVVHFDKNGRYVNSWGELGSLPGQFSIPHAIAVDSKDRVYVADRNNVRVQVFDRSGKLLDIWKNVITPWGITMTRNDELVICGSSPMQWRKEDTALGCPPKDQLVMRFNPAGKVLQLWTAPKGIDGMEKPGELNWVHAVAVDSKGNLYAGDIKGQKVQKFVRVEP